MEGGSEKWGVGVGKMGIEQTSFGRSLGPLFKDVIPLTLLKRLCEFRLLPVEDANTRLIHLFDRINGHRMND